MMREVCGIHFHFTRKNVKNINLRVTARGIFVSAGRQVPMSFVDGFVARKAGWIEKALKKAETLNERSDKTPFDPDRKAECEKIFAPYVEWAWALFAGRLKEKPEIKVKNLKSAWGICHFKDGYISLSAKLAQQPPEAIQYVVLHEFVHFFEPNHGVGFHKLMETLMPDYKARRKLLK